MSDIREIIEMLKRKKFGELSPLGEQKNGKPLPFCEGKNGKPLPFCEGKNGKPLPFCEGKNDDMRLTAIALVEYAKKELEKKKEALKKNTKQILVTARELYEILCSLDKEKRTYMSFLKDIKNKKYILNPDIPPRCYEVPHPKNKRQWQYLFDITEHDELIAAHRIIKAAKKKEKENSKKIKLTIELDREAFSIIQEEAKQDRFTVEETIYKILKVHTYKRLREKEEN